jgi:hypothetical protein
LRFPFIFTSKQEKHKTNKFMKKRVGLLAGLGLAAAGAYAYWKYRSLSPEERQELKDKVNATGQRLKNKAKQMEGKISDKYDEIKDKASDKYNDVKSKAADKAKEYKNQAEKKVDSVKS